MLYLITGGSGSGKSEYAENKLCELSKKTNSSKVYLATMIPYGKETEEKINRHRQMRAKKNFQTEECFTNLPKFVENMKSQKDLDKKEVVLLECMSNLVANELFDETGVNTILKKEEPALSDNEVIEKLTGYILNGVEKLNDIYENIVIVTNEVFSESTHYSNEMSVYKQVLGKVNCELGKAAVEVAEVVYGQAVLYKNEKVKCMDKKAGSHLIIGGAYQGKLEYAKKLYPQIQWADGEMDSFEKIQNATGIYHFEIYIKRILKNGKVDIKEILDQIFTKDIQKVIICNEVGYGLVPVDSFERYYREQVGRICTTLAKQADKVTRVVCGIGTEMK